MCLRLVARRRSGTEAVENVNEGETWINYLMKSWLDRQGRSGCGMASLEAGSATVLRIEDRASIEGRSVD
jgi:hypothetical protein